MFFFITVAICLLAHGIIAHIPGEITASLMLLAAAIYAGWKRPSHIADLQQEALKRTA